MLPTEGNLMRGVDWATGGVLALFVAAPQFSSPGPKAGPATPPKAAGPAAFAVGTLEVAGLRQCSVGRRGIIAPVPLHPVIDVKVVPGERVRKGQLLVVLDDEPRADVRLKEALLDSARHAAGEARRFLTKAESVTEILPEQRLFDARLAVRKAEADERAAQAAVDSARAELEHYRVAAALDGVVSSLDVYSGVVARPGTTVWGEIVDLRELDVRCELTPAEANRVAVGQKVKVGAAGSSDFATGTVTFISPVADAKTGRIPAIAHFANPHERLRCGVSVSVRFTDQQAVCNR